MLRKSGPRVGVTASPPGGQDRRYEGDQRARNRAQNRNSGVDQASGLDQGRGGSRPTVAAQIVTRTSRAAASAPARSMAARPRPARPDQRRRERARVDERARERDERWRLGSVIQWFGAGVLAGGGRKLEASASRPPSTSHSHPMAPSAPRLSGVAARAASAGQAPASDTTDSAGAPAGSGQSVPLRGRIAAGAAPPSAISSAAPGWC